MTPNPFAPPKAELSEPPRGLQPPPPVRNACFLIVLSFMLGLVTLWPGLRPPAPAVDDVPFAFTLLVVALFGALTWWLVLRSYQGRGWARWVLLAYLGLSWWLVGSDLQDTVTHSPLAAVIDLVCVGMEMTACWILVAGRGRAWFAPPAGRAASD